MVEMMLVHVCKGLGSSTASIIKNKCKTLEVKVNGRHIEKFLCILERSPLLDPVDSWRGSSVDCGNISAHASQMVPHLVLQQVP